MPTVMNLRVFVLPTQYDIIDFRFGRRPENILVRDFADAKALAAYQEGLDAIGDPYERVEALSREGQTVHYTLRKEDPESETVVRTAEASFASPGEADAYCQGLSDAEGYAAPLLVDDTDERHAQLAAWAGNTIAG